MTALHSFPHGQKRANVLASAFEDGSIRIWDVNNVDCLQTIRGHDCQKVVSLESIGTRKLASRSFNGTIRVWDISFHSFLNHWIISTKDRVHSLRIPPTGERDVALFVIAFNRNHRQPSIKVWNLTTDTFPREIPIEEFIIGLEYVGGDRIAWEESGCRSDQSDQFFRSIRLSFGTFIIET